MNGLENDYPNVRFVYMTGHLDGSGTSGNLNQRNEQIRNYCTTNGKTLYDFNDIESYDPDGNYYLDKDANETTIMIVMEMDHLIKTGRLTGKILMH